MKKVNPIILDNNIGHGVSEMEIVSVLINGEFKTVVFRKQDGKCYIIIGNSSAYDIACYYNNYSRRGYQLISGAGEWYEVEKTEGNMIYKSILSSQKISKKGRPYYRWNFKEQ